MEKYKRIILFLLLCVITTSCVNDLNVSPKGIIDEDLITSPADADKLVTAAYSYMPSLWYWDSHNPWMHGSIRSDDAYKGGGGLNDQTPWYEMEIFTSVNSNVGNNDGPWYKGYCGISRINAALRLINTIDDASYPEKSVRIGEMKFLRAWNYLNMKLYWKYIPYIDETVETTSDAYSKISNRPSDMTNDLTLYNMILADAKDAVARLPETQKEIGRVNKVAAEALTAKILLYMAYEQDDAHHVININTSTLTEALKYCNDITALEGGQVGLCPDFANNFLPEYDNATKESIWETQYSIDDGTNDGRVDWGDQLNAPWWAPHFGCCDFHKVSYNLANAFRTGPDGLPLFNTFNDAELKNNYVAYFKNNTFDPRFSHTVAVPGQPWKYDPDLLFDSTGSRAPFLYGYMNSLKENVSPSCPCLFKPFYVQNSMNKRLIRYAEVLLWKAEILIQLGRQAEALPIINEIRRRAANSEGRLIKSDGTPILNYKIALYVDGVNCNWTKDFALKALEWEDRLEMACEGRRFFDLMRWGKLEPTMNKYFMKEKTRYDWLSNGHFTAGRDEFLPIPQPQINFSKGVYVQNPGY